MVIFDFLIVSFLGLAFGSFANVLALRLPEEKSILSFSKCPKCKSPIKYYDNIPLISYLILKGKSRCCKKMISFQYPTVELLSTLFSILIFVKFGFDINTILLFYFFLSLLIIFVSDLRFFIIPNEISYSLMIAGISICFFNKNPFGNDIYDCLIAGTGSILIFFVISKIFFLLKGKEGLGLGDVKLIGAIGFWIGIEYTLFVIILSSLLGITVGYVLISLKKFSSSDYLPYGCFLVFSAFVAAYFKVWLNLNLSNFMI